MAKYYYKRYQSKPQYSRDDEQHQNILGWRPLPRGDVYEPWTTNPSLESAMVSETLGCDPDTGYYAMQYKNELASFDYLHSGTMYLVISSPTEAWSVQGNGFDVSFAQTTSNGVYLMGRYTITPTYIKGELVDEVIAEDGTYPNDGRNEDDGYWYVKDRMAIQFFARMNGAWTETQPRVRANGAWCEAEIHPRIDGAWLG